MNPVQEAAHAVGCEVGAIVKSLVFLADGEPLIALVSGPNRVDTALLGRELAAEVTMSDARKVKEATGYSIGGVPPFGHSSKLRTVIDADLLRDRHHRVVQAVLLRDDEGTGRQAVGVRGETMDGEALLDQPVDGPN